MPKRRVFCKSKHELGKRHITIAIAHAIRPCFRWTATSRVVSPTHIDIGDTSERETRVGIDAGPARDAGSSWRMLERRVTPLLGVYRKGQEGMAVNERPPITNLREEVFSQSGARLSSPSLSNMVLVHMSNTLETDLIYSYCGCECFLRVLLWDDFRRSDDGFALVSRRHWQGRDYLGVLGRRLLVANLGWVDRIGTSDQAANHLSDDEGSIPLRGAYRLPVLLCKCAISSSRFHIGRGQEISSLLKFDCPP